MIGYTAQSFSRSSQPVRFQGWFQLPSTRRLQEQIQARLTDRFDEIPEAKETAYGLNETAKLKVWTNKKDRVLLFLKTLKELPAAHSMRSAYKQMTQLMLAIENIAFGKAAGYSRESILSRLFKCPWVAPSEHWMSIPGISRLKETSQARIIYANGHYALLGAKGAIRVQAYQDNAVLLDKAGCDNRTLRLPESLRHMDPVVAQKSA